ncbi:LssY C-terminal domain-containing protein [Microlunatus soli]|uniref:LssY C-terminus n=1 Tax=Microlunatus soli TaxID=630515 RepID=A0A1H2AL77_9ACTN|nr:LssY C-terminal domain-containing protein [Microlunatus soli]SDT46713.1 LssY C-terminus [Microlunatus soli]
MTQRQDARSATRRRPYRLRQRIPEAGPIDQFFFIIAGIAAIWLTIFLLREGFRWNWSNWLFFILFWAMAAYLTLPRLHRILSDIYVPNYFIGRTRTSDGLLGDPINLAFRGDEHQLHQAMRKAGWTLADEITLESAWQIIRATLTRRSYSEAPVSPLLLFGRQQDFAYQQEVDGSPGKRHHVRFWRTPQDWPLPGGHRVDWLAAATYDRAVGVSLFTLQITHKIDADIDIERDYVTESITTTIPDTEVTVLEDFTTGYHSRNGGGDSIHTDGDLPIIELPDADDSPLEGERRQERALRPGGLANALEETKASRRRPLSVLASAALVLAGAAVLISIGVADFIRTGEPSLVPDSEFSGLATITGAVVLLAQLILIVLTLQGKQVPRLILMFFLLFSITVGLVDHFGVLPAPLGTNIAAAGLQIAGLMMLSSNSSREYAVAARQLRHDTRQAITDINDATRLL